MVVMKHLVAHLSAFTTLASAYAVPAALQDGVYYSYQDENGKQVIKTVSLSNETSGALNNIAARGTPADHPEDITRCGCGIALDRWSNNAAWSYLLAQTRAQGKAVRGPNTSTFSVSGDTVSFYCQYAGGQEPMPWEQVLDQLYSVQSSCGDLVPGSRGSPDSFAIGYMKYWPGLDFCKNAFSSSLSKC